MRVPTAMKTCNHFLQCGLTTGSETHPRFRLGLGTEVPNVLSAHQRQLCCSVSVCFCTAALKAAIVSLAHRAYMHKR